MKYEEMLDTLAERECKLFYEYCHNPTEANKAAHEAAKAALEAVALLAKAETLPDFTDPAAAQWEMD